MLKFCSIGSGSKGNGTLVSDGVTTLLVDCGFGLKETVRRLLAKDIEPQQLTAILVTHEHSDHIKGVTSLSNKYNIPVWLSRGTSLHKSCDKLALCNLFNSHKSFKIGNIRVTPVPVPHDSREATQFVFSVKSSSLGILTDIGHITEHVKSQFSKCKALMLEFNYDYRMLMEGKYPRLLKQRVAGNLGHLSNDQACEFLTSRLDNPLDILVVMHRSEENNTEKRISESITDCGVQDSLKIVYATQTIGFEWQFV
ncbi:MAG: MBL fold metallo-hydrolase [Kangiellaceae bacterium]|jgi:phosphoribosyl 1,2-cyclic phosphodiesterase